MKTTILLCAVSILIPFATLFAQGEPCDFDQNGIYDISDLIQMANLLLCNPSMDTLPDYWPMGDCDRDSVHLTLSDMLSLGIRLRQGYSHGIGQQIYSNSDTLYITGVTAYPGQTVSIPIRISSQRMLYGLQMYLRYDSSLISITEFNEPDTLAPNQFTMLCNFIDGFSASALPFATPGIFRDPLGYIRVHVADNIPVPSQAQIAFANDPHRAVYTGFAFYDSTAEPPAPNFSFIRPVTIDGVINIAATAVHNDTAPNDGELSLEIWGNPANLSYQISFHLPQASDIELNLYDILGRCLTSLAGGRYEAGDHIITWDAGSLSSGIYFLRLAAGDEHVTRKMTLLK